MEKIGLIVATESEFKAIFLDKKIEFKNLETSPFLIKEIILNNKKIIVINSGIGEIYSSIATQYLIDKYNVELILNYGVVGSLRDDLGLNSCVTIDKIFDYDFDTSLIDNCEVGFHTELDSLYVPSDDTMLSFIKENFSDIQIVTCASGNKFITDSKVKDNLFKKYHCSICEMESLGIALTCIKNNIKYLFIKGVSDTKNGGANEYKKMVDESSLTTFNILKKITKLL